MGKIDDILALAANLVLPELSNHVFSRMERVGFAQLTPAERTFRLVEEVLLEVNNGGFHQYFSNSSGDHAWEAVTALEGLGAVNTAGMLRRAIAAFGAAGPHRDWEARQEQVGHLPGAADETWAALDREFYASDDAAARELAFVQANRHAFLD